MKRDLFLIVLTVGLLTILAGGFGPPALAGDASVVVGVDTPPVSMDPASSFTDANVQVVSSFFEALVGHAGYEGTLVPLLAERWERTGQLTWKIWLRKGVKFHNGNPFTAADVEFTLKRMLDPECCSEFLDTGKMVQSIEVIDDYTMVLTSAEPNPAFMEYIAFALILDKESTEGRDVGDIGLHPIGTGPYKLVEWVKGSYVKVTANEDYWAGPPAYKNAEIQPITESSTRFAALASGKVQMIQNVPVELFDKVKSNPNLELVSRPGRRTIHLALSNKADKPWADLRVRQAIYMAINEDEIAEKIMRGQAIPATQLADPAETGYVADIKRLPYDVEKAKQLLAEAGYPDGFEMKLTGPNDRYINDEKILEAVAKYLAKIGIKCKLDIKPKAVFFPELVKGEGLDMYLIGWLNDSYDQSMSLNYLLHSRDEAKGLGSWNGTSYSDPELDKMIEASADIMDPDARRKALEDCVRRYMGNLAIIPLHWEMNTWAIQKASGLEFKPRPDNYLMLKELKIK